MSRPPASRCLGLSSLLLATTLVACGQSEEDRKRLGLYLENAYRYYSMGEFERCVQQAEQGLKVDPDNERFLLVRARGLLMVGDTTSLESAWLTLGRLDDLDNFQVQVTLGGVNERRGSVRADSARQIESGQRFTEHPDPAARAAELRAEAQGMWEQAIVHYRMAEDLFPGSTEVLNGMMRTATLLGDEELALESGRALLMALRESNQVLERTIADLRGEERDPVEEFRSIRANEEVLITTHIHLAEVHHAAGRRAAALSELEDARAVDETRPEVHGRLAQLLLELGDAEGAAAAISRFFALSTLPFDHPDVIKARETRRACDEMLAAQAKNGG